MTRTTKLDMGVIGCTTGIYVIIVVALDHFRWYLLAAYIIGAVGGIRLAKIAKR